MTANRERVDRSEAPAASSPTERSSAREQQRARLKALEYMANSQFFTPEERADYLLDNGVTVEVPEPGRHEFTEDVSDGSMCICGVPALTHHLIEPAPTYHPGDVALATVRGVDDLEALPVGSVVREADTGPFLGIPIVPGVFEKFPTGLGWHVVAGHGDRTAEIEFPATVLHVPVTVTSRLVLSPDNTAQSDRRSDKAVVITRAHISRLLELQNQYGFVSVDDIDTWFAELPGGGVSDG